MNNVVDENIHHKDTLHGVSNVCRLCSATDNLIDFFNGQSEISDFFRSLILYGTGLEIKEDDVVSKMVCQRCCEIAVKLHRYRSKAMSNDKLLKAQYGIPQEQSTNRSIENALHLFNGHDNIGNKSDFSLQSIVAENTSNISEGNIINRQFTITHKDVIPQPKIVSRRKYRHPSVVKLHKQYSSVIIPQKVFSDDVSPVITLDKSEVTDWYKVQLQNLEKKLPHIKFKKVTDVNSSSNIEKYKNKYSSSNAITSTPANNDVTNKNIILKRSLNLISTCSRKDSSINDQNKPIARATSDTNRNSRLSVKAKVRPTARKSTTTIKANVPKQTMPIRKRSLSNSSTSTIGDYAAFFDNALPNSPLQSEESDSDRPKKRPCSRTSLKKRGNLSISSSSSQTGFISDKPTENSKSFATATTLKAVSAEKRKERDRKNSASHNDLISDKGTQESKSPETVRTFKIVSMEKRKERKDRSSSSSNSLIELIGDKPTENCSSLGNLAPIKAVATEKRKKSEEKDMSHSASSSKCSLTNDKLEMSKFVERTSMIKALLADKREEISCLQKSEKRAPKILQKARKKTAKVAATSVKDKMTENGKISKKKNKKYFNKDMVTDFNGFDVSDSNRTNWSTDVNVLPGKSTSDIDSLFVLTSGKTLAVFICAVCSLVCDTKRQLVDHEKTHLTCKFCKVKIKNVQLLIEHLNDTCVINVMRDNARVRLVRVDDNPSIVEKYRTAFQNDKILDYETDDDDNDGGAFDNNDDFVKEECDQEEPLIKHEEVKLESTENETDIICLSDTNDDPVEFSVVQRHTIVEEEDIQIDDELKIINRTDDNNIYLFDAMLKHHSSETEMMKTLFKKYYHGLIKFDKRSQTFRNSNRCVRRTSNNLILLERMLSELTVYIVAVNVECRASITARFNAPQTPPVSPLEYWGHKKTTCIIKRVKSKSGTKPKEVSLSSDLKSQKHPPIQVVSVEPKIPLKNMSIEEITSPPQTPNASSLPRTIPASLPLVKPSAPNSFQKVFIISSNIPTNTSVGSVPISLIPTPDAQVLPNANFSLITTTTSNSSVSHCSSNPSTSGNQNNLMKNKFEVVSSSNVPQPTSEAVIQDANCISSNQPNATSSSNPATVE
ncbi:hypothetical protein RI129_003201 [Pyrocoelia pectoralis]|uniref:ZAD domain-containing protein n=1 Tax=Pyrocoelia pectoralis TaxID=417401 RepID=A0AAN7VNX5_9COLE